MKKLAIGCLVLVVLGGIVAAGLAYYAYRQVSSTVAQFAELGKVAEIEKGVRAQGNYVPPASDELTASQVERFVRVQTTIRDRLGERFTEMERKYKTLSEKENASLTDLPAIVGAYRDMTAAWMDAKRAQVDALNQADLSIEEYRWIREKAYSAIGVAYVDLDFVRMVDQASSGGTMDPGQLRGAIEPSGPEANRKLVEPYKKQLEASVALASFGL